MSKRNIKTKKLKTFRENYYSEDVLSERIYKKGDKIFFILFPYSQPDNFKVFSGEILYHVNNTDFTVEYAIQIHTGFDRRESLKDFFHNNWFKTLKTKDKSGLTEYTKKFSFTDHELVEQTDDYFDFGKYHTFFRNNSEKFTFLINEAFVFDKLHVAAEYCAKMSIITICNKMKDLHDLMCDDSLRLTGSPLYTSNTMNFYKMIRPLIIKLIEELGDEYTKFLETDQKIKMFFDDYILNRRYRRMEFTKSRKAYTEKKSTNTRKREKDI